VEHPRVLDRKRLTDDQPCGSHPGLPQGHDRQEGHNAGGDQRSLQSARCDQAECTGLPLSLDHRVEHHRGADTGQAHDDLQDGAHEHRRVRAGTDNEVRSADAGIEQEWGRNRDEGEQIEQARNE